MAERVIHSNQDPQEQRVMPESRLIRIGNGIDLQRTHNLYSKGAEFEDQCFRYLGQNAPDGTLVLGPSIVDSIPQLGHRVKCDAITLDVSDENTWRLQSLHEFKVGNKGKEQTGRKIEGFTRLVKLCRNKPYLLRKMLICAFGGEIFMPQNVLVPQENDKITFEFIFAIEKEANQNRSASASLSMLWLPYEQPNAANGYLTPRYVSTMIPAK